MINEVKIDHTEPVWAEVWDDNSDKRTRIYLFSFNGHHYCVRSGYESEFLKGDSYLIVYWRYIELPKAKKTIPLDAKTCPRRRRRAHGGQ